MGQEPPAERRRARRLLLARCVLRRPVAIVLDDLLDGVETALAAEILDRLAAEGIAVVVMSTRLITLTSCDRILTLVDGRLEPTQPSEASSANEATDIQASAAFFAAEASRQSGPPDLISPRLVPSLAASAGRFATRGAPSAEPETCGQTVRGLAAAFDLRLRRVRLYDPAWERRDSGPLLVKEGGEVSGLVRSHGRYHRVDADGATGRLPPVRRSVLPSMRYTVTPVADIATRGWFGLFADTARAERGTLALFAAAAASEGIVWVGAAAAVGLGVSDGASVLALASAGCAGAFGFRAREDPAKAFRACDRLDGNLDARLWDRILQIPTARFRVASGRELFAWAHVTGAIRARTCELRARRRPTGARRATRRRPWRQGR